MPAVMPSTRTMSSEATSVPARGAIVADERRPPPPLKRQGPARSESLETGLIATIGTAALLLMVVGAFVIVAIAAGHPTFVSPFSQNVFPGWMAGPLRFIGKPIHVGFSALKLDYTLGIGAAFLCWLIVVACATRMHARIAIAGVVALHVIFFLAPPLSLTDVFNYINYGRMGVVHGLNPYTTIPALEPHTDPTFLISNWHHLLSPYGPLFTLFTYALVPLGVAVSFWVLKALLLVAALATLRLVWRCAEMLGRRPLAPTLFVGANPLVLLWGLGGDHNDFFMVFLLMLAVYLLLRAREQRAAAGAEQQITAVVPSVDGGLASANGAGVLARASARGATLLASLSPSLEAYAGFALIASVAIKASAAVLVPVMLFATPRRVRLLVGMAVAAVVLGTASVVAFGPHLPDLSTQGSLVTADGLPNLLGLALGQGGETDTVRVVLDAALLLAVAGATFYAWRTRRWIPAAGFAVLALLLTLSWELPWYVYWLLPLAALSRARSLRVAGIVLSAYLILAWMPMMSDFIHTLNFHPSTTPLGAQHAKITKRLLRQN
jgi:hypothetical protein